MDTSFFTGWLDEIARRVAEQREHLTRLDAAIGDADHGTNLNRGFAAVKAALAESPPATPGAALTLAGTTLIRKVGGASGPLYGTAFRQMGRTLGDTEEVTLKDLATAMASALAGVQRLGAAAEGDKTMVDALAPAVQALTRAAEEGAEPAKAFDEAARAAREGAKATVPMQARKGRASYLGPRSVGHEDPGAASTTLILEALRAVGAAR